jgi:uncharacterized membrane protein HdeD (DUF308 family)
MATETARHTPFGLIGDTGQRPTLAPWWLLLVTGIGWVLVSLIVLRFDYSSVSAVSLLFGFVALGAGATEIARAFLVSGGWSKLLASILAVVFIAAGIIAFIHPGDTFRALAGVFSFVLVFGGAFDIAESILVRKVIDVWWLQLVGGIIEVVLGFWAAGYWGRSATLLIAWVAAFAIVRGIRDIALAFQVRSIESSL